MCAGEPNGKPLREVCPWSADGPCNSQIVYVFLSIARVVSGMMWPCGRWFLLCFWGYFTGSSVESFARLSDTALMAFELCGRKVQ